MPETVILGSVTAHNKLNWRLFDWIRPVKDPRFALFQKHRSWEAMCLLFHQLCNVFQDCVKGGHGAFFPGLLHHTFGGQQDCRGNDHPFL
jgi:hypothetical protein